MTTQRSDEDVEKDVKEKLIFEPQLDSSKILISTQDGVVTLLGTVETFLEKGIAERATKSVRGVRGVANNLKVDLTAKYTRTDTDIANAALSALKWHVAIPEETIQVIVEDGNVTLTGNVNWWHQRKNAEKEIRNLCGVRSINNLITIQPTITPKDIKKSISQEFHRNASIDVEKINIEVEGRKVILRGKLNSWYEIKEAKKAAWAIPGVVQVEDYLTL